MKIPTANDSSLEGVPAIQNQTSPESEYNLARGKDRDFAQLWNWGVEMGFFGKFKFDFLVNVTFASWD